MRKPPTFGRENTMEVGWAVERVIDCGFMVNIITLSPLNIDIALGSEDKAELLKK